MWKLYLSAVNENVPYTSDPVHAPDVRICDQQLKQAIICYGTILFSSWFWLVKRCGLNDLKYLTEIQYPCISSIGKSKKSSKILYWINIRNSKNWPFLWRVSHCVYTSFLRNTSLFLQKDDLSSLADFLADIKSCLRLSPPVDGECFCADREEEVCLFIYTGYKPETNIVGDVPHTDITSCAQNDARIESQTPRETEKFLLHHCLRSVKTAFLLLSVEDL